MQCREGFDFIALHEISHAASAPPYSSAAAEQPFCKRSSEPALGWAAIPEGHGFRHVFGKDCSEL